MCGIFGLALRPDAALTYPQVRERLQRLYLLSESRGKESAGFHISTPDSERAWTLKGALPATELIRTRDYTSTLESALVPMFEQGRTNAPLGLLAHSRLVTNGAAERPENNQPVRYGGVTVVHNGIIVNVESLWRAHANLDRSAEVDTQVFAAIVSDQLEQGRSGIAATQQAFSELRGAASIAWTADGARRVILATNTGDLHYCVEAERGILTFASERYILEQALNPYRTVPGADLVWLRAGNGVEVDLDTLAVIGFDLQHASADVRNDTGFDRAASEMHHQEVLVGKLAAPTATATADERLIRYSERNMRAMRRCKRCVLPETFPFISYDDQGVCNYCRSYKTKYKGVDPATAKSTFIASLERYRSETGLSNVIVPFSGGRDSSYGLHLIKHEFGLNPITFTYDWGMVTDLARRNIARICGQLGIQNILVSADIKKKRRNIRMNVSAWLKQPDLGMVPLFMAGDKHFFSVVNQLKRQTGVALDLWSANPLENTDFKSGFCGIAPDFDKSRVDYLSFGRKARLAAYYGSRFLMNPRYVNTSLLDTAGAFMAYYVEPRRDFFFIFDHMVWDERVVDLTLLETYDWELSPDSPSTWRIGDGTAPFYNYIYMSARGFTEFDTFRSNQIREGMITREEALERILIENRPRVPSLRWYLQTIGLDFNDTVKRINQLDTLGLHAA